MRLNTVALLLLACATLIRTGQAESAQDSAILQPDVPVLRTLSGNQSHRFYVNLKTAETAQVVVEQRGIDVLVRVAAADGSPLAEFDSPGAEGSENVPVVAVADGRYSIVVMPLSQNQDLAPGQYEIRLIGVRRATSRELKSARGADVLKARGLAMVNEVEAMLKDVKLPESRIRALIQMAQAVRTTDERLARRLINDAAAGLRDYIERPPVSGADENQRQGEMMNMRREALTVLAQLDPALAVDFMQATRLPAGWNMNQGQGDPEMNLELSIATQIASQSPELAAQIAENALSRGYDYALGNVVSALGSSSPVMAARFARAAAAKLQDEDLLNTRHAAILATSLLRVARAPARRNAGPDDVVPLLSDQEFRHLFSRSLSAALAFSPEPGITYSPEMSGAAAILEVLQSMAADVERIAAGSMPAIQEKSAQLMAAQNPRQKILDDPSSNQSVEDAMRTIAASPPEMRDSLHQQLALRVASDGDPARARNLVNDRIVNIRSRENALNALENQVIQTAMSNGRFDDALRALGNLRGRELDRVGAITNTVMTASFFSRDKKQDEVLAFMEQCLVLIGESTAAEGQEKTSALLRIADAFARQGSSRGFEIIEALVSKLNDLGDAAVTMNGFGLRVYQGGELLQNGNVIANTASELGQALGRLAPIDFERARRNVNRIRRPDIRLVALCQLAQRVFTPRVIRRST